MCKVEKTFKLPNGLQFHLPSRRMNVSSLFLIRKIFKEKLYFRKGFEIKKTDTVVDIGANMGMFVMWAVPQALKGKIIAIEPTESIDVLHMNLKKNNIGNVETIRAAMGFDDGYVEITTYPGFNVIDHPMKQKPTFLTKMLVYSLTGQWKYKKVTEKFPSVSLEKIMDNNHLERINFLKINAEGCEFDIFRNLSDKCFDKIEKIAMEFHEYYPGNKYQELEAILKSKGYKVTVEKPLIDYYLVGKCGFIWAKKN